MVSLGFMSRIGGGQAKTRTRSKRRHAKWDHDDDSADDHAESRVHRVTSKRMPDQIGSTADGEILALQAGFSMEQARAEADVRQEEAMNRTPADVLAELQRGNARFWTGQASRPERSAFERRALISKQFPSVAVLGCSDSRVPVEIVFDQGLGDMFVIRVAGNCMDTTTTASMLYAVHHLKVKVLVVMGHEGCGAVKAAQLPGSAIDKEPEILGKFLKGLKQGLAGAELQKIRDVKAQDREAVTTNVKVQVEELTRDKVFMEKVRSGELLIVGGFYEISSGIVDFFHEVSGAEGEAEPIQRAPSRGVLTRWRSAETAPQ